MGADSTLVTAAFKEAESRYGGDVIDRSAEYTSTVDTTRQSLRIITGVMDELKKKDEAIGVARSKRMDGFKTPIDKMWKKLYAEKENLPDKFIDAIEAKIRGLQEEFELVNTFGKGDNIENERARRRISGDLQRLTNSAINTRGGLMALSEKLKNLNISAVNIDDFDGVDAMVDLIAIQDNENISIDIDDNMEIRITNKNYYGEANSVWGERSLTAEEIGKLFKQLDLTFDKEQKNKRDGIKIAAERAASKGEKDFDKEVSHSELVGSINTKEKFDQIAKRRIEGIGAKSFRDQLLNSGDLQVALIQNMFIDDNGERMEIGLAFAALDENGDGRITGADKMGLTGEALETWVNSSEMLVNALTNITDDAFDLKISVELMADMFVGYEEEYYDKMYNDEYGDLNPTDKLSATRKANIAQFQKAIGGGGVVPAGGKTYYKHDPATGTFELYDGNISSTIPKSQGYTWDHLKLTLGQYMSKQQLADLDKLFGEKYTAQTPSGIGSYQEGSYIPQANLQEEGSLD